MFRYPFDLARLLNGGEKSKLSTMISHPSTVSSIWHTVHQGLKCGVAQLWRNQSNSWSESADTVLQ